MNMKQRREIKFRAWDHARGEFVTDIDGISLRGAVLCLGCSDSGLVNTQRDIEIQQYTGFKDKNGVEIYEGDVVKLTSSDGYLQYGDVEVEDIVSFSLEFNHDDMYYQMDKSKTYIIGHIYEN